MPPRFSRTSHRRSHQVVTQAQEEFLAGVTGKDTPASFRRAYEEWETEEIRKRGGKDNLTSDEVEEFHAYRMAAEEAIKKTFG